MSVYVVSAYAYDRLSVNQQSQMPKKTKRKEWKIIEKIENKIFPSRYLFKKMDKAEENTFNVENWLRK